MPKMKYQIKYGFSVRSDGDMRRTSNIDQFLSQQGLERSNLITGHQVHGTKVHYSTKDDRGKQIPNVDALIYQQGDDRSSSIILGVLTADCVPILVMDSNRGIIAAVHSGWKGTLGGIVTNTIASMIDHGSRVVNIFCVIGPHIRSCCYSVPKERADLFQQQFGKTSVVYQNSNHFLDLTFAVRSQILAFKIDHTHIIDQGLCTACNEQLYYSFRKDTKESFGEMLGFIAI
jgi:polyphenol oxidase